MDKVQAFELPEVKDTQVEINMSMAFLRLLFPTQHPLKNTEGFLKICDAYEAILATAGSKVSSELLKLLEIFRNAFLSDKKTVWYSAVTKLKKLIVQYEKEAALPRDDRPYGLSYDDSYDDSYYMLIGIANYYRALLLLEHPAVKDDPDFKNARNEAQTNLSRSFPYIDINYAHYLYGFISYHNYHNTSAEKHDKQRQDYKLEAYRHLTAAEESGFQGIWLYRTLADISEDYRKTTDAIFYLTYVVENDETAADQIYRLGRLYDTMYFRTGFRKYALKAVYYCDLSDEKVGGRAETYFVRGRMLVDQKKYDEALSQVLLAVCDIGKKDIDGYYMRDLAGRIYRLLGIIYSRLTVFDKAIESFEHAILTYSTNLFRGECSAVYRDISTEAFPYGIRSGEAVAYFENVLRELESAKWGERDQFIEEINGYLSEHAFACGDFEKGRDYLTKLCMGSLDLSIPSGDEFLSWSREYGRAKALLDRMKDVPEGFPRSAVPQVYQVHSDGYLCRIEDVLAVLCDVLDRQDEPKGMHSEISDKEEKKEVAAYAEYKRLIGSLFDIYAIDHEKGCRYLEEAYVAAERIADDYGFMKELLKDLMRNAYLRGDSTRAWNYAHDCREFMRKEIGNLYGILPEEALRMEWSPSRWWYYRIAMTRIAGGEVEKARESAEKMADSPMCGGCQYAECYEQLSLSGWLAYESGDMEEADRCLRCAGEVLRGKAYDDVLMLKNLIHKKA